MLGIHPAILGGLGMCFVLLIYTLWEEQVKQLLVRGLGGILTMWIGNMIVPSGFILTWDFIHILIAVVFGIPGVLVMFLFYYFRG